MARQDKDFSATSFEPAEVRQPTHAHKHGSLQVLFRLASRPEAALPPALSGPQVTGPLAKLVSRAQDYAAAASGKDAQVLHGAWCAEGVLCKVSRTGRRVGATASE